MWWGVLGRGILQRPEEAVVELSAASMSEQGKRKARESWLGHAHKGKRGVWCGRRHAEEGGGEENGACHSAAAWERRRRALVRRRERRA
jgi:hypothetical protein